jgi:hypothetical protein
MSLPHLPPRGITEYGAFDVAGGPGAENGVAIAASVLGLVAIKFWAIRTVCGLGRSYFLEEV